MIGLGKARFVSFEEIAKVVCVQESKKTDPPRLSPPSFFEKPPPLNFYRT